MSELMDDARQPGGPLSRVPEQEQPDRSVNTDERPDCDKCNGTGKLDPSGSPDRSVEELAGRLERIADYLDDGESLIDGPKCREAAALLRKLADEKRELQKQLTQTACSEKIDGVLEQLAAKYTCRFHANTNEFTLQETLNDLKQDILDTFCRIALPFKNDAEALRDETRKQQERIEELEHEYVQACDRWVPQLEALLDDKRALLERIEELEEDRDFERKHS